MPPPPPPEEDDAATLHKPDVAAIAAAVQAAATAPTAMPRTASPPPTPPAVARTKTPPPIPKRAQLDSSPEIQIIDDDEHSGRTRAPRDTAVNEQPFDSGVPAAIGDDATRPSDGIPPFASRPGDSVPPLPPAPERHPPSRPPSHGAATLPPMARPPTRPAMTPPTVMSRPLANDARARGDSDAVEVYAPAPPSAEPPPGERAERPGQYSVNRRAKEVAPADVPMRERTGRIAIPSGLARPPRQSDRVPALPRANTPSTSPAGVPQPIRTEPSPTAARASSDGIPQHPRVPSSSDGVPQSPDTRPSGSRTPHLTAPMASRSPSGSPPPSNVVMTRPAVIVGAPPKPAAPPSQRVRKAREDEGRGFGQGLISEKSLDEVILAYLSEDADEK